jgi:hypothetical protein
MLSNRAFLRAGRPTADGQAIAMDDRGAAPPAPTGPSPQPEGAGRAHPLNTVVAILLLLVVVVGGCLAVIKAAGWATPVEGLLKIAAAGLGTVATGLVGYKLWLKQLKWWIFPVAGLLFVGVIWLVVTSLDDGAGLTFSGELTAEQRSARHVIKSEPGQRVFLALETTGGLEADLRLSRGPITASGTRSAEGRVIIDDTLPGGTWTAQVLAVGDSTGSYELSVSKDAARPISFGDVIGGETLVESSDSNGYNFRISERQKVFIGVTGFDPPDLSIDVKVYKSNGFAAAKPHLVDGSWQVLQALDPDRYVIVIEAPGASGGSYSLTLANEAPGDRPVVTTTTAPSGQIDVPAVVHLPQDEAESRLLDAGFAPRSVPVCSSSVPGGIVREVVRIHDGQEIDVVGLDGVLAGQRQLEAGTGLILKVGTGESCDR